MSHAEDQAGSFQSAFGAAIEAELAVLASIEARYWDERTKLEASALPSSVKDHLREQLEAKRNSAREPHVIRLAELHEEQAMRSRLLDSDTLKGLIADFDRAWGTKVSRTRELVSTRQQITT